MRTDVAAPGSTSQPAYRHALALLVIVLAVLAGGLGAAAVLQPPRLNDAQISVEGVVSRAGQTLELTANQPVHDVVDADVTVTPSAPFSVTTQGASVQVSFPAMLDYATEYVVTVRVTSASTGATGEVSDAFTTPDPVVQSLERTDAGDRIVERRLSGGETRVLYEAPSIAEFAAIPNGFATIESAAGEPTPGEPADGEPTPGEPQLLLVPDDGGPATTIDLRGAESVSQLHVEPQTNVLGVVADGALVAFDLQDATLSPFTLLAGGAVERWMLLPGTTTFVARDASGVVSTRDAFAPGAPTTLGSFLEIAPLAGGGVAAQTDAGWGALALDTGAWQPLPAADAGTASAGAVTGSIGMTSSGPTPDGAVPVIDASGTEVSMLSADGIEPLYTLDYGGELVATCVAGNGRVLQVTRAPEGADASAIGTTTLLIDIATGAPYSPASGVDATLCP